MARREDSRDKDQTLGGEGKSHKSLGIKGHNNEFNFNWHTMREKSWNSSSLQLVMKLSIPKWKTFTLEHVLWTLQAPESYEFYLYSGSNEWGDIWWAPLRFVISDLEEKNPALNSHLSPHWKDREIKFEQTVIFSGSNHRNSGLLIPFPIFLINVSRFSPETLCLFIISLTQNLAVVSHSY